MPTGLTIVALFALVSYSMSSHISRLGLTRAESLVDAARSDLRAQGTLMLTTGENALSFAGKQVRASMGDVPNPEQAANQTSQSLLEPRPRSKVARP